MIKVENKKIEIIKYKKNNPINKMITKNRLTDYYLDYIMYRLLPKSIADEIYSGYDFVNSSDDIYVPFDYSYLKFIDSQTINDSSTTMDYDIKSDSLLSDDVISIINSSNRNITYSYGFDLTSISNNSLFTGIGFGRNDTFDTNYLLSFVDLSTMSEHYNEDISYSITRYDEISSNQTVMNNADASYLPIGGFNELTGKLQAIWLCYGENATGDMYRYELSDFELDERNLIVGDDLNGQTLKLSFSNTGDIIDTSSTASTVHNTIITDAGNYIQNYHSSLTGIVEYVQVYYNGVTTLLYDMSDYYVSTNLTSYTLPEDFGKIISIDSPNDIPQYITIEPKKFIKRLSAGIIEITGYPKFYDGTTDYPQDDYPQDDYPQQEGKVLSVKFEYLLTDDSIIYTYLNIEDLDINYNNTEFKIKLKIERGDY